MYHLTYCVPYHPIRNNVLPGQVQRRSDEPTVRSAELSINLAWSQRYVPIAVWISRPKSNAPRTGSSRAIPTHALMTVILKTKAESNRLESRVFRIQYANRDEGVGVSSISSIQLLSFISRLQHKRTGSEGSRSRPRPFSAHIRRPRYSFAYFFVHCVHFSEVGCLVGVQSQTEGIVQSVTRRKAENSQVLHAVTFDIDTRMRIEPRVAPPLQQQGSAPEPGGGASAQGRLPLQGETCACARCVGGLACSFSYSRWCWCSCFSSRSSTCCSSCFIRASCSWPCRYHRLCFCSSPSPLSPSPTRFPLPLTSSPLSPFPLSPFPFPHSSFLSPFSLPLALVAALFASLLFLLFLSYSRNCVCALLFGNLCRTTKGDPNGMTGSHFFFASYVSQIRILAENARKNPKMKALKRLDSFGDR